MAKFGGCLTVRFGKNEREISLVCELFRKVIASTDRGVQPRDAVSLGSGHQLTDNAHAIRVKKLPTIISSGVLSNRPCISVSTSDRYEIDLVENLSIETGEIT